MPPLMCRASADSPEREEPPALRVCRDHEVCPELPELMDPR